MTPIYELVKDRRVYSIEADNTVLEGARFMMEHRIGALPVLRDGQLVGIFSERDIMNRVVAVGRTPGHTVVSEVMTANPRAVNLDETIEEGLSRSDIQQLTVNGVAEREERGSGAGIGLAGRGWRSGEAVFMPRGSSGRGGITARRCRIPSWPNGPSCRMRICCPR